MPFWDIFKKPDVEELERKKDAQGLIRALKSNDLQVRIDAVRALGELRDSSAVLPLNRMLIGNTGYTRPDPALLKGIIMALGKIGDEMAAQILIFLLVVEAGDRTTFDLTAEQLKQIGYTDVYHDALTVHGWPNFPGLRTDDKKKMLRELIKLLAGMDDPKAFSTLLAALKANDSDTVETAIRHIAMSGREEAIEPLIWIMTGHKELSVRRRAAWALSHFGDSRVVAALTEALSDEEETIRASAASALGQLGTSEAIPALVAMLGDPSTTVLHDVMEALGKIGDLSAAEPLVERLLDGNEFVRGEAGKALKVLRWKPTEDRHHFALAVATQDWGTVVHLGDQFAAELADFFDHCQDFEHQAGAAIVLVKLGGEENLARVRQRLEQLPTLEQAKILAKVAAVKSAESDALIASFRTHWQERLNHFQQEADSFYNNQGYINKTIDRGLTEFDEALKTLNPPLDGLVIIFTRDFSPKDTFINSILTRMYAHGRSYKEWMLSETPMIVKIHPAAQNPQTFIALATVEFRALIGNRFSIEKLESATFEGSDGISGVILSHWNL